MIRAVRIPRRRTISRGSGSSRCSGRGQRGTRRCAGRSSSGTWTSPGGPANPTRARREVRQRNTPALVGQPARRSDRPGQINYPGDPRRTRRRAGVHGQPAGRRLRQPALLTERAGVPGRSTTPCQRTSAPTSPRLPRAPESPTPGSGRGQPPRQCRKDRGYHCTTGDGDLAQTPPPHRPLPAARFTDPRRLDTWKRDPQPASTADTTLPPRSTRPTAIDLTEEQLTDAAGGTGALTGTLIGGAVSQITPSGGRAPVNKATPSFCPTAPASTPSPTPPARSNPAAASASPAPETVGHIDIAVLRYPIWKTHLGSPVATPQLGHELPGLLAGWRVRPGRSRFRPGGLSAQPERRCSGVLVMPVRQWTHRCEVGEPGDHGAAMRTVPRPVGDGHRQRCSVQPTPASACALVRSVAVLSCTRSRSGSRSRITRPARRPRRPVGDPGGRSGRRRDVRSDRRRHRGPLVVVLSWLLVLFQDAQDSAHGYAQNPAHGYRAS